MIKIHSIREVPGMGHNSQTELTTEEMQKAPHSGMNTAIMNGEASDVEGIAGKRLLSFFDRIERLEEEKAALAEDIKEVYLEAKSAGFEVKIMRRIMKLRKMEIEKRREEDQLIELYMSAIGME